jgi:hypothetical protein
MPLNFKERRADLYGKIRHAAMVNGKSCIPPKRNSRIPLWGDGVIRAICQDW